MGTKRIESYKQFAKYLEYPMVVFEAESGKVLDINHEAEEILGGHVDKIQMKPGRAITKTNFWELLHDRKSLMWNRIRLVTDDHEYLVSGLANEVVEEDKVIYTLLFEPQADLNLGSLIMERILKNAGLVALHLSKRKKELKIVYISENINQFGYTRDQMYDGMIKFSDLICQEDWEKVEKSIADAVKSHKEEIFLECRLFTESRELIPIRIHNHYVYNDNGSLTDIEMLVFDLRENLRKNSENTYLSNAVEKMKSVVLVKSYHAGARDLKYVSPNAGIIGINAEALRNGYKLTEDYIHPADRDMVIDTVYQAIANGVTDYVHSYRLVRDDGKQIWVQNEVTVNRISDGEAEVSFLLTDITEQKDMEKELAITAEGENEPDELKENDSIGLVTIDRNDKEMLEHFQLMAETLNQNADYYSIVLGAEGELLTNPVGPLKDLGQFYDLFERPQFKEQFSDVTQRVKDEITPKSVSFTVDRMNVHMIFAPLMLEDVVTAYWVLTSFSKNGQEILGSVIEQQWRLANSVAKCFYAEEVACNEEKRRKVAELQLQWEQQGRNIVLDIMDTMTREGESSLGEMCQKAGSYLAVVNIGIYLENKDTENVEKYFVWNRAGDDTSFFDKMELSISEYQKIKKHLKEEEPLIIDRKSGDPFFKKMLYQTDTEVIMIHPLKSASGIRGYIVFADTQRGRKFEERDINFSGCVAHMFATVLLSKQKAVRNDITKQGFLESYDHMRDAVFVKDNKSGDIIFANKAMDKLFGYSLIGMRAKDVVNDQLEQYRNMEGMRKRFITNKKVTKWQSYMKELDQIMNIVEIHLETLNKTDYSLFILKKNKNKKYESD